MREARKGDLALVLDERSLLFKQVVTVLTEPFIGNLSQGDRGPVLVEVRINRVDPGYGCPHARNWAILTPFLLPIIDPDAQTTRTKERERTA